MTEFSNALQDLPKDLLPSLVALAQEAGKIILAYRGAQASVKADRSPVTEADHAADRYIVEHLGRLTPEIPVVSEEGGKPDVQGAARFYLVDPLDGTKSFVRGTGDYTVNIGLIERGVPVLGVIYLPVSDVCYFGQVGAGAFRQRGAAAAEAIRTRAPAAEGVAAVVSMSHYDPATDDYLARFTVRERVSASSSVKFCQVAEGAADLYPRLGPTSEWDTAAGHAIVLAAGGRVETPEGGPFTYGKAGFLNGPFVAFGFP